MSSGKMDMVFNEDLEKLLENNLEGELNISRIIIPFSKISTTYKPIDIYSGSERIPFKERDPEFKMIFRQEFSDILR